MTIFVIATADDWNNITYAAIDATEADEVPKFNNYPEYGIFFVLAMILAGFLGLNLIVSVLNDLMNKKN